MHFRFLHVFLWIHNSFIFSVENYSIVWMKQFIHLPTEGHFSCLKVLTVMTKDAINLNVQAFICTGVLNSSTCIPRSAVAELYIKNIMHFVRNCLTV